MLDKESVRQQEALGVIGINLVHGTFYFAVYLPVVMIHSINKRVQEGQDAIIATDFEKMMEALRQEFSLPVEVLNPFARINYPGSGPEADLIGENAGQLAVAVGLALRSFDDL